MFRRVVAVILMLLFATTLAWAGDKKDYFSKLKGKVSSVTPRKGSAVTTAVGGVRAAKVEDSSGDKPYWKDKDNGLSATEEELDKFNAALALASDGKDDDAIKAFDEFLATYPESQLRPDAMQAIDTLKASKAQPQQ